MALRPELPRPIPKRIERLPVARGYPVPWFVGWMDDNGNETRRGVGTAEFRVASGTALGDALRFKRCWVCGEKLGSHQAFVLGPMCAVNRTSAEPPNHVDCADWSARACPFLARPHARRREGGLPDELAEERGIPLLRNPGVALVWVSDGWRVKRDPNGGILFDIGDPRETRWYAQGRPATREEVEHSIDTGIPALAKVAEEEGPAALAALEVALDEARPLLPA